MRLISLVPLRNASRRRHAALRTQGTSNKPRVSASSGANTDASVNAELLNANVVEDWGGGSYLTEGQRDRERERERDRERYHSFVNGGRVAAVGRYGLSVLPAEPR